MALSEERFWSPVNSPSPDDRGKVEYIIHRVEDVTEFVQKNRQPFLVLPKKADMAERLEQMEAEIFRSTQHVRGHNETTPPRQPGTGSIFLLRFA